LKHFLAVAQRFTKNLKVSQRFQLLIRIINELHLVRTRVVSCLLADKYFIFPLFRGGGLFAVAHEHQFSSKLELAPIERAFTPPGEGGIKCLNIPHYLIDLKVEL
jgi:hypothetical protein